MRMILVLFAIILSIITTDVSAQIPVRHKPYLAYTGDHPAIYFDNSAAHVTQTVSFVHAYCYFDLRSSTEPFLGYVVTVIQGNAGTVIVDDAGFPTEIYYGDTMTELQELSILIQKHMLETQETCE